MSAPLYRAIVEVTEIVWYHDEEWRPDLPTSLEQEVDIWEEDISDETVCGWAQDNASDFCGANIDTAKTAVKCRYQP